MTYKPSFDDLQRSQKTDAVNHFFNLMPPPENFENCPFAFVIEKKPYSKAGYRSSQYVITVQYKSDLDRCQEQYAIRMDKETNESFCFKLKGSPLPENINLNNVLDRANAMALGREK